MTAGQIFEILGSMLALFLVLAAINKVALWWQSPHKPCKACGDTKMVTCPTCEGSGTSQVCPNCDGSGSVSNNEYYAVLVACPECLGLGHLPSKSELCRFCHGTGQVECLNCKVYESISQT